MSSPLFEEDILFYQRLLKCSGYYRGNLDGDWGPITGAADQKFNLDAENLKQQLGSFDSRTEGHIATMHIKAQAEARKFMKSALSGPNACRIISGTRSYKQQDELYKKGRWGNLGPRVTNARGGQSNHNFCIAWDIGLFAPSGEYLNGDTTAEIRAYEHVATLVDLTNLTWGGNWSSFKDRPHYQFKTGKKTSAIRPLFESGQPYV